MNSPKRNKSKLLLSCRGGKPFNLQNKLSEFEIELDILAHFFPFISFHLSYTHEKCDSGVDQRNISISAMLSLSSLSFVMSTYKLLKSLFSTFLLFKEKTVSEEIVYLAQLTNQKSDETNLIDVLKKKNIPDRHLIHTAMEIY